MKKYILLLVVLSVSSLTLYSKNYKGAEFRTKAAYTYGRFEVNYKSVQRDGVLSTFFTYHEGTGGPTWNEIDIEILGRYEDNVQFNTITPGQTNHVRSHFVNFNPSLDYHTYAFEWTPEYVAWFIDDIEVHRQTGAHIQTITRAQKIMMNIWIPAYENWVGIFNPAALPAFAYYDWVKYYSYTPGSGSSGTNNNFTYIWKDDFDNWDQSRWDKATHTWDGNNCDFVKENAVFRDGKLILCLTTPENPGYTDVVVPAPLWSRAVDNKIKVRFTEDLEKASAENKSLFIISGVTINNVELLQDNCTVELTVTGLDPNKSYALLILGGIKDLFGNLSTPKAISINMPKNITFPFKVNVGGSAYNDYAADQEWSDKTEYGYLDGSKGSTSAQINNTEEDAVFQNERYGLVTYKVRVPDGTYKVTLMSAENYFTSSGSRLFDIYVEGILAADNLDLYKEAGKNTAHFVTVNSVVVSDGILDIHLPAEVDNAVLNGIVIESVSTGLQQEGALPNSFELFQNYPNPFNGETKISYILNKKERITFTVFDMLGNEVYRRDMGDQSAGYNDFSWDARNNNGETLASGMYIYSIAGALSSLSRKLVLLK